MHPPAQGHGLVPLRVRRRRGFLRRRCGFRPHPAAGPPILPASPVLASEGHAVVIGQPQPALGFPPVGPGVLHTAQALAEQVPELPADPAVLSLPPFHAQGGDGLLVAAALEIPAPQGHGALFRLGRGGAGAAGGIRVVVHVFPVRLAEVEAQPQGALPGRRALGGVPIPAGLPQPQAAPGDRAFQAGPAGAAGADVDDPRRGAGAVQPGGSAPDHLDGRHLVQGDGGKVESAPPLVAPARGVVLRRVDAHAVHQDQHLVRPAAADGDAGRGQVVPLAGHREPRHLLQHVRHGLLGILELLARNHRARTGAVLAGEKGDGPPGRRWRAHHGGPALHLEHVLVVLAVFPGRLSLAVFPGRRSPALLPRLRALRGQDGGRGGREQGHGRRQGQQQCQEQCL